MTALEEMKRRRDDLNEKIALLEAETVECEHAKISFRKRGKDEIWRQVRVGNGNRWITISFCETKEETINQVKLIVADLQKIVEKLENSND